jgi:hypothetical protein
MNIRKVWLGICLLLVFSACQQAAPAAESSSANEERRIYEVMRYGDQYLPSTEWYILAATDNLSLDRSSVAWTDGVAVVHIVDYVAEAESVRAMFSVDWVTDYYEVSGYEQVDFLEDCETDGTQLFLFDLSYQDTPYKVAYWLFRIVPIVGRGVSLAFPANREDELRQYAQRMFPQLPHCD